MSEYGSGQNRTYSLWLKEPVAKGVQVTLNMAAKRKKNPAVGQRSVYLLVTKSPAMFISNLQTSPSKRGVDFFSGMIYETISIKLQSHVNPYCYNCCLLVGASILGE